MTLSLLFGKCWPPRSLMTEPTVAVMIGGDCSDGGLAGG